MQHKHTLTQIHTLQYLYTPIPTHTNTQPLATNVLPVQDVHWVFLSIFSNRPHLTAVLKEGWTWRVWSEVWHWRAERRWSTSRKWCLDWWWRRGQRQLWCWWRGAEETPLQSWARGRRWGEACQTPGAGILSGAGPAAGAGDTGCTADVHSAGVEERWEISLKAPAFVHWWYYRGWTPL